MKTIKILFLLLIFSAVTSCSDSNPIENNTPVTQKSITLRTALNQMKVANNVSGKGATLTNPFCFEFVYPIVLSYSNGTTVTVGSFGGLIELLGNESPSLYLNGIVFPFQVTYGGAVHTIHSETEFTMVIINCGYNTYNIDLLHTYCFDLVFPIMVVQDGVPQQVGSQADFEAFINNSNPNTPVQIEFPISVTYNGQIAVIHNEYEFYQMVNSCNTTTCICTQEYAPVCVQTATGIVEFGNMCYAICAGYTQNDLVPCNPSTACNISNLQVTAGSCQPTGGYALTVNFTATNPSSVEFQIVSSSNVVIGTYALSALPVTIPNYPNSNTGADYLHVNIGVNCSASQQWAIPNCGCNCPTNFDPVCVQTNTGIVQYDNACLAACAGHTVNEFVNCGIVPNNFGTQLGSCFNMVYPVQIQYQGALVTVHSDSELLQYYFPNLSPQPAFVYPIVITIATPTGTTMLAAENAVGLQALISAHCN